MSRPTKSLIEAQARYIGGSLTELPYSVTQSTVGVSAPTLTVNASGWWGPYYGHVAQETAYHRLEYGSDLIGDPQAPDFPLTWAIVIPNTAQSKPQQVLDQIFVGDPMFSVKIPSKAKGARDLERKLARYLMGSLQNEERASDISPLQEQAQLTLLYGLAARYDILDIANRWPEKPERRRNADGKFNMGPKAYKDAISKYDGQRRGKDPFVTRTLSPLALAYDRTNNPPKWVMIREPIMPWDAALLYPQLDFPIEPTRDTTRPLCWTRYWTDDYYACYVDGVACLEGADEDGVVDNPYGFIPVWPSGGAFGELDIAGRPEVELAGILRANIDSFRVEAILLNALLIYARRAAFGPKVIVSGVDDPQDAQRIEEEIMTGPERVIFLPPNAHIDTFDPSALPPAVLEMRAETRVDIDRGVTYDVAGGDPNPSQSGVSRQIVQQQIGKKVSTTILHLQQSLEAWAMCRLKTIRDVLQESVSSVYGSEVVEIRPEDIPEGLIVTVDLLTDSAAEKARKLQEMQVLTDPKHPIISMETGYRDYMQLDDPEAETKAILREQIYETVIKPTVLQVAQSGMTAVMAAAGQAAGIEPPQQQQTAQPQLQVGPAGTQLPGEQHNPAYDGEMTPERLNLEQRQMMGQTNGTRPHVRVV